MDIAAWLRGLGLGRYEAAFRDNEIRPDVLPSLTAEDLKEIGVAAVGDRRRLLDAIAALRAAPSGPSAVPSSDTPSDAPAPELPSAVASPAPTAGQATASAAERRQVTVLFCDLAGSTALAARLDPEDLREVMAAYHGAVAKAVQEQGGYVAKFLGDGVLAYFGWPQAHEDDAERAIRAGLAATQAVSQLSAKAGPLAARVGIATGPVVVGDILGEGEARERGVVGETPNLAARLQSLAEPGAVVLDDATRRLTGELFDCGDLGGAELKGLPHSVRAWRALGEGSVESRFEALRAGRAAPLIGREEELELLLRRWRRARSGEGQVALLRGEAGIGKSRLTAALQEALQSEEHEGFVLFCSPQHTHSALHPVVARLERVSGLKPDDAPEARLVKLEALLTPLDPPPEDVALLAELLSVPTLGRWPALDLVPQRRRERLLHALLRRVRALAARRPVLAVVEDAHWADPSTRELLDLLVARAPEMALLLVVTQRPEFDPGAWIGMHHVTALQLNRLAPAEHKALLRRVAGGKALPAEVEAEILSHTDGVPLFVEEVGRAVLEGGLLREEAGRWVLDGPLRPLAVPASLQASLVARLDRLASVREAAQAGAVLGREFAHDLLAAVSGLPEPALRAALDRLAGADLIQRRGAPPEAAYTFRHALIQDAAHGTLLRERRRELHARAAAAMERLRPEALEREPEVLARHHAEAGAHRRAAELFLAAGRRHARGSAAVEAVRCLDLALDALGALPDREEARRAEAEVQLARIPALMSHVGFADRRTKEAIERALALWGEFGMERAALPVLFAQLSFLGASAEIAAAAAVAERILRLGGPGGPDALASLVGHRALGFYRGWFGDLPGAEAELDRAVAAAAALEAMGRVDRRDLALEFGHDPITGATQNRGSVLVRRGRVVEGMRLQDEALRAAEALRHPLTHAYALFMRVPSEVLLDDRAAVARTGAAFAAVCERHGVAQWRALGPLVSRWAALTGTRAGPEDGREVLRLLEEHRRTGFRLNLPFYLGLAAEVLVAAGDPPAAINLEEEARAVAGRTGEAWALPMLARLRASLALIGGPGGVAQAERCLLAAVEQARGEGAKLAELNAARDLARLWRGQGRLAEARDLLAPVCAAFTDGFGFPALAEARTLLEGLGQPNGNGQPVRPGEPEAAAMRRGFHSHAASHRRPR